MSPVNDLIWLHPSSRVEALGDALDTLISELLAQGPAVTPGFSEMCRRIAAIKKAFPKEPLPAGERVLVWETEATDLAPMRSRGS